MSTSDINTFMQQVNFTNEQSNIFQDISLKIEKNFLNNDNATFLLSGAAGTGKTYLLTELINYLSLSYSMTVTAPTNKALSVIESNFQNKKPNTTQFKTIHSFLNIKLVRDYTTGEESFQVVDSNRVIKTDILIIDESSMISKEMFTHIQDAFKKNKMKIILFVGDPFQLLPINNEENVLFATNDNHYRLTEIVRQAQDSYIIDIATQAREIIEKKEDVQLLDFFFKNKNIGIEYFYTKEAFEDDFCKNPQWENEDKVITCFTNNNVNMHNDTIRNRYWKEQKKANHSYFFVGERLTLQEGYKTNMGEILLNNQEIILTYAKQEFLENIGIYIWVCKDQQQNAITIVDPLSRIKYQKFLDDTVAQIRALPSLEQTAMWVKFFTFKHTFAKVKAPYSATIHKLQGSTYKTIYLDITDIYAQKPNSIESLYRLIYVALTRASTNIKILLPVNPDEELNSIKQNLNSMILTSKNYQNI